MANEKKYIYEFKGVRTGWSYRLSAILPGAILPQGTIFDEVKLPLGSISLKTLKAGFMQSAVGLATAPILTFEVDSDMISGNDDYDEFIRKMSMISQTIPVSTGFINIFKGIIWTLECDFNEYLITPRWIRLFKGISRNDNAFKYDSEKQTIEVSVTGLLRAVYDSVPIKHDWLTLLFNNSPEHDLTEFGAIIEYLRVDHPIYDLIGIVQAPNEKEKAVKVNALEFAIDYVANIVAREMTRELQGQTFNVELPLPQFYKQNYLQNNQIGAALEKSALYVSTLYLKRSKAPTAWDLLNSLCEYSFKKADFGDGTVINYKIVNNTSGTVFTPQKGKLDYARADSKGSLVGTISATAIEVNEDDEFKDVSKFELEDAFFKNSQKFDFELMASNYPSVVIYEGPHEARSVKAYQSLNGALPAFLWSTKFTRRLGVYYKDVPQIGDYPVLNSPALFRCHEFANFTGSDALTDSFNWKDGMNADWFDDEKPTEAILEMQKSFGHANQEIKLYQKAFGGALPKIEISIDFDDAIIYDQVNDEIDFIAMSLSCLWDFAECGLDTRIDDYNGYWEPFSYELDFTTEKSKINLDKIRG
jgi:hypothetical protein